MTADPVPRYNRDRATWSAEDFARHDRSGVLPINPEWIRGMHEAADTFGLEDPISDTDDTMPIDDLSAAEHLDRIQGQQP